MAEDTPLRRWRISRQLNQSELAQRLGVQHVAISRYERGERIPGKILARLHAVTRLPYAAFLSPREYLAAHPDLLPEGIKPFPKSPRKSRDVQTEGEGEAFLLAVE
jgi:transcriptional regulator with XRE-family HTH domain